MLNADKMDVMLIGTSGQLHAADHISEIVVAAANLKPVAVIKSLGVILNSCLTFAAHLQLCARLVSLTTHMPSFNTRRRQHISMQHCASTLWLLQLNLARCINVVDYQDATSAELVGSCGAAATETN